MVLIRSPARHSRIVNASERLALVGETARTEWLGDYQFGGNRPTRPISKDAVNGPILVSDLALVYAWTSERDRALEQLEIVATIPDGPSYGDLKFNPCWDSLRADPRFDKIVAAAKAASN